MGHGAWGMGHGAWGIGHWAWGMGEGQGGQGRQGGQGGNRLLTIIQMCVFKNKKVGWVKGSATQASNANRGFFASTKPTFKSVH